MVMFTVDELSILSYWLTALLLCSCMVSYHGGDAAQSTRVPWATADHVQPNSTICMINIIYQLFFCYTLSPYAMQHDTGRCKQASVAWHYCTGMQTAVNFLHVSPAQVFVHNTGWYGCQSLISSCMLVTSCRWPAVNAVMIPGQRLPLLLVQPPGSCGGAAVCWRNMHACVVAVPPLQHTRGSLQHQCHCHAVCHPAKHAAEKTVSQRVLQVRTQGGWLLGG